jgi:hypothetical protein
VGVTLVQLRQYTLAQAFSNAAARASNTSEFQARAELVAKLKRWEELLVAQDDPAWPVQQILLHTIQGDLTPEILQSLLSRRAGPASLDRMEAVQKAVTAARQQLIKTGLSGDVVADWMLSLAAFDTSGDAAHGYRIQASTSGGLSLTMYVVREDTYRIISNSLERREAVGDLVLELVAKGDVKEAQWWLDQTARDSSRTSINSSPAIYGIWSAVRPEGRGPEAIKIAANSLIGISSGRESALAALEAARAKAANALEQSQLDKAICETLDAAEGWDRLMIAATRLEASKMFSADGFDYFVRAAEKSGKWKELETEARARIARGATSSITTVVVVKNGPSEAKPATARSWLRGSLWRRVRRMKTLCRS